MQKLLGAPFIKFLMTSGTSAMFNILLRYILTPFIGYNISIFFSYLFSMTIAWILARLFVFSHSTSTTLKEYTKFTIVNIFSLIQVWGVSVFLDKYVFPSYHFIYYPETVAHALGIFSLSLSSYWLHKHFTFNDLC
jgi:putative flippase GtrA